MQGSVESHIDRAIQVLTQAKQAARFSFDSAISNAPTKSLPFSLHNEDEETVIRTSLFALSECNWVIGQSAAAWIKRFSRGRTDADFGAFIGLGGEQVFQRRRVWELFWDTREKFSELTWSHFCVAVNWVDAIECLRWANDMSATVSEMKAWRRAQHGEDLSVPTTEDQ